MKLIVCGGRDNYDYRLIDQKLTEIHTVTPITLLIHGDAPGVDRICQQWAMYNSIEIARFPANWEVYKSAAGPIRNTNMARKHLDAKLAPFKGGYGTKNMLKTAKEHGLGVLNVDDF